MANLDIDKQLTYVDTLKQTGINKIKEIDAYFTKRDNDLLAIILHKYYNRDNYDGSTITENDYVGDKKAYISFLASDKEDIQKLIAENQRVFEKYKHDMKKYLIDIFKYMGELYKANAIGIEELEKDIISRKKQSCKLNELIAVDEKEVEVLKQDFEKKQAENQQIEDELNEITAKIEEIDKKVLNISNDDSINIEEINSQLTVLIGKESILKEALYKSSAELITAQNKFNQAQGRLSKNKSDLEALNIEDYENKLKAVKEGNEKLKETIDKDHDEFAALGYDITAQDIIDSNKPTKASEADSKDNSDNTKSAQQSSKSQGTPQQQQQVPNATSQPQQQSNLPVTQTPAQRAHSLKTQLLGGSDEDAKNLISDSNNFSGIVDSISNYNNKDKKRLMDRIGKLNSPLDVNKLSNVISAISRSGYCSGMDISEMFDKNGMLKDFSQLSNDDIDNLNKFITEIDTNKEFIDEGQLEFIQNNLVNNIKCNSLKQSLKPKRLRDFIKSKNAREQDKVRTSKLSILSKTIALPSVSAKKVETPSKNSNFINVLTGNTIPPQQQTVQQAPTNQPPQQTGPSR